MPQTFALVARVNTIQKTLGKTAEELTDEEREHIHEFLAIAQFKKYGLPVYFYLLGSYAMKEYPNNPAAEHVVNNMGLMHEMLEYFAEGRADLPANLLPQFKLYLDGWVQLAKCYEQIAERVEKHHEALAA